LSVAVVAMAIVANNYRRAEARQIVETFSRAVGPQVQQSDEVLNQAVETLAESLSRRFAQATHDKAQLQTILSSMTDGLIAVDHEQRVLLSNRAAEQLLSLAPAAQGRHFWEALPPHMQPVVQAAAEVMLTARPRRFVLG